MARSFMLRSLGASRVICMLVAIISTSCGDEGVRPSNGDTPVCVIDPSTIDFGAVETGEFVDTTVAITNAGDIPFVCRISTASSHYRVLDVTGADTLEKDDRLVATLRFEPYTVGAVSCAIKTGCGACGDIPCTGTGFELSVCDIDPVNLDFGALIVGELRDLSFIVRNAGDGIILGEIAETGEHYTIVAGDGPYAIGAGESVSVTVRYEPVTAGDHGCTIETGTAACTDVACTGSGAYIWRKMDSGATEDLYGVWGSSGDMVVTVGDGGAILQYDGASWRRTNSGTAFPLFDIWGSAEYDIFVVGAARTLLHHNGYSWGFMTPPAAGDLHCIDGTGWNNVFAGGKGAIHYDGSAWTVSL